MREKREKRGDNFLRGAMILSLGVILVKGIGAVFKIPLTNLIGELGMGYFNTAYQLYLPVYTIATAGFPVSISRMVAQAVAEGRLRDVGKIFRVGLPFFLLSGGAGTGLLIGCADWYAGAVHSPEAAMCIKVLAPTVFFCAVMAVFRGVFEGMGEMLPTALSQTAEAVCKLFVGLFLAHKTMERALQEFSRTGMVFGIPVESGEEALRVALPYAAAGAVCGVTVGAVFGTMVLILYRMVRGKPFPPARLRRAPVAKSSGEIFRALWRTALPVCAGALAINLSTLVDVTFLQKTLGALDSEVLRAAYPGRIPEEFSGGEVTTFLFGCYSMAQNVAMLVPSVAQAFGVSALPAVTAAWTKRATEGRTPLKKAVESVLRTAGFLAFPCGAGLFALAGEILALLFAGRPDGVAVATPLLRILAPAVVFMTLSIPLNSMLQAMGKAEYPVYFLLLGMICKLAVNYFAVSRPEINLRGACFGSVLCYGLLCGLGLWALCAQGKIRVDAGVFLRPLLAGGLCGGVAWLGNHLLQEYFPSRWATVIAIGLGGAVYLCGMILLEIFRKNSFFALQKSRRGGTIIREK